MTQHALWLIHPACVWETGFGTNQRQTAQDYISRCRAAMERASSSFLSMMDAYGQRRTRTDQYIRSKATYLGDDRFEARRVLLGDTYMQGGVFDDFIMGLADNTTLYVGGGFVGLCMCDLMDRFWSEYGEYVCEKNIRVLPDTSLVFFTAWCRADTLAELFPSSEIVKRSYSHAS